MAQLSTVEDYVADARILLQDSILPYRYSDADLVEALNVTILEILRVRADLLLSDGTDSLILAPPHFSANDDTEVPVEYPFRQAVVWNMVAWAISRDQEDVQDERAQAYEFKFMKRLLGL